MTLTADEIQQKVNAAGYSIGKVANVQVTKRTATDNVNEVTVTDTSGKSVTISRSSVRTVFWSQEHSLHDHAGRRLGQQDQSAGQGFDA